MQDGDQRLAWVCIGREGGRGKFATAVAAAAACLTVFVCMWLDCAEERGGCKGREGAKRGGAKRECLHQLLAARVYISQILSHKLDY